MTTIHFTDIKMEDKTAIEPYLKSLTNRSCQFAFANLICLANKYKTQISLYDDVLYMRQLNKVHNGHTAYFLPICKDKSKLQTALNNVLQTSRAEGHKAFLYSVIGEEADRLKEFEEFNFTFDSNRDWSEYLYLTEELATLSGSELARQRRMVKKFEKNYSDLDIEFELITKSNIEEILLFQERWFNEKVDITQDRESIKEEHSALNLAFRNFEYLDLFGIAIRINCQIEGYAYGSIVSGDTFDKIAEKGNYNFQNIYKVISQEMASSAKTISTYTNMEEDIGIDGLREMKLRYKPCEIIDKINVYFG